MAPLQAAGAQGKGGPFFPGRLRWPSTDSGLLSYYNTVGSKEGWTPSTFVSSRTNRHKDKPNNAERRPEDYMDEEDLEAAAEAQKIQTSKAFAGLGSSTQHEIGGGGLSGLLRPQGDTMGIKLLRRMGWKDGQGVGPKVRRGARLDMESDGGGQTYLFAPDDVPMIRFDRKTDHKGLGHRGESKLSPMRRTNRDDDDEDGDMTGGESRSSRARFSLDAIPKKKPRPERGGIGVGILNDNGSDEEDPFEIGPKIKYNRVIGAEKKKKAKKPTTAANPLLRNAPAFVPKSARAGNGLRRCHDGRLPLDGFVLAKITEDMAALWSEYAPPAVPEGWISKRQASDDRPGDSSYVSAADAAKASNLDPRSRAALLGEKALPGKSVFDYLSPAVRDKLAVGSGRSDLPQARGEVPAEFRLSEEEKRKQLWDQVPKLDSETATAALSRSASGPYADDEAKRDRYRSYLESQADPTISPPTKPKEMTEADYLREASEFYNCARIFKPMTGFMASRFTTAKTTLPGSSGDEGKGQPSEPVPKVSDPAEEAARMGMFGKMTRTVEDFYPTRLLCKRFNVKPPAHARQDNEPGSGKPEAAKDFEPGPTSAPEAATPPGIMPALPAPPQSEPPAEVEVKVNPSENEAVEGTAAHAEVLKAIFGDSDSDE